MAFKDNIRAEREKRDLTIKEAAHFLKISSDSIAAYEFGSAHPRWKILKKIIDGYRITDIYKFLFE